MNSRPKVMGLDLSLTSTGVAVLQAPPLDGYPQGHAGRIRTTGHKGDSLMQRRDRIDTIVAEVTTWLESFDPDLCVIEAPSYGSTGGAAHDRSGLWWRVVKACSTFHPVGAVAPTSRAKYATGNGRADKEAVVHEVRKQYSEMVEIPDGKSVDDICDAITLAAIGLRKLGHAVDYSYPFRDEVVGKAEWPAGLVA